MSVKGVTGHLIGAAGATEAVAAILAVRAGTVPPTANFERLGDDIVARRRRRRATRPRPGAGDLELVRVRRPQLVARVHAGALSTDPTGVDVLLDGKRILVTGVLNDASIAFSVAELAQQQGAEVVLSSFGRAMSLTRRAARRLPTEPEIVELDVTDSEQLAGLAGRDRRPARRRAPRHRVRTRVVPRRRLPHRTVGRRRGRDAGVGVLPAGAHRRDAAAHARARRLGRRSRLRQRDPGVAGLRLDGRRQGRARRDLALPRP